MGFPGGASGKEPTYQYRRCKRCRFNPWVGKIPWRRAWQPPPVFLSGGHGNPLQYSGKSHGQRSLVGYSPWHHERVEHDGNGLVRVCMCAHTHMCTHMHTYMHARTHTCTHAHTHTGAFVEFLWRAKAWVTHLGYSLDPGEKLFKHM